jgi:hypothetical protein
MDILTSSCPPINGRFCFSARANEFSTAGIGAILRIENERERRRKPKDAVYGWTIVRKNRCDINGKFPLLRPHATA